MILPLEISELGKAINYLIYFLIGTGFGVVLELAGFGDSRKLAAQFYFKDMRVLKTMFTGIIVCMVLIFLFSSLGYLDFTKIFVNQTYLWPGIIGGLIMGVGFIVGGYCPGTSVVSSASLKFDGVAFLIGAIIGAGLFGESVGLFEDFWNSSYTERLLLSDWFGWSIGLTLFFVVSAALVLFYFSEKIEAKVNHPERPFSWRIENKKYLISGLVVFIFAAIVLFLGQPGPEAKWEKVSQQYQKMLQDKDVFIHPLEYVKTWNDASIKLLTLDFRSQEDFKKFHLDSAKNASFADIENKDFVFNLNQLPAQGVVVIVANNDDESTKAWRWLKAQGVTNLYILDKGMDNWIQIFSKDDFKKIEHFDLSKPSMHVFDYFPKDSFVSKIKLKTSKRSVGLCS